MRYLTVFGKGWQVIDTQNNCAVVSSCRSLAEANALEHELNDQAEQQARA